VVTIKLYVNKFLTARAEVFLPGKRVWRRHFRKLSVTRSQVSRAYLLTCRFWEMSHYGVITYMYILTARTEVFLPEKMVWRRHFRKLSVC